MEPELDVVLYVLLEELVSNLLKRRADRLELVPLDVEEFNDQQEALPRLQLTVPEEHDIVRLIPNQLELERNDSYYFLALLDLWRFWFWVLEVDVLWPFHVFLESFACVQKFKGFNRDWGLTRNFRFFIF